MLEKDFKISRNISEKIYKKHNVIEEEVYECFLNRDGSLLKDSRLNHRTDPPTMWFIARTDHNRLLKIVFIEFSDGRYEIKTAYEPNEEEVKIYERYA